MWDVSLSNLIESYRRYLELHQASNPKQLALARFDQRLRSAREAAQTEAVVFEFLRSCDMQPRINEDVSIGGSDFECAVGNRRFAVEATALADETVSAKSGVSNDPTLGASFVDNSAIVASLRSRLSQKAAQAARYAGPRVLAIGSTHMAAAMLFSVAVEELLTGESSITIPVGPEGRSGDGYMGTSLKNAAAVRANASGGIEVFRRKYALVLFVAIHGDRCSVTGLVHPDPEFPLPYEIFPRVPFARLRWPIKDNMLYVEWVIGHPRAHDHRFRRVELSEAELRNGIK
jgi:hypothetical protein